jgi:hypothetical protein
VMQLVLKIVPTLILTGLSLAAQTGTRVSGVATTAAPCSPSVVASQFKNEEDCTFIENKYEITKVIQQTKSVTVALSKADLDYIAKEVAQLILASLQQGAPDGQIPAIYAAHSFITGSNILGSTLAIPSTNLGDQTGPFQMAVSTNGSLSPAMLSESTLSMPSELNGVGIPAYQSLPFPNAATGSTELAGTQSIETDQFLRINAAAVASSTFTWLSNPATSNSIPSAGGIAGYLQVGPDGSLQIRGSSDNVLGSSIALAGTAPITTNESGWLTGNKLPDIGAGATSPQASSLVIGSDGLIQINGVSLRTESKQILSTAQQSDVFKVSATGVPIETPAWLGSEPATSQGKSGSEAVSWPPCGPGVVITISANGTVTPCDQRSGDTIGTHSSN